LEQYKTELLRLLEKIESSILNKEETTKTVLLLGKKLNSIRNQLSKNEWKEVIQNYCQTHSLNDLLLQDPFTRRAFTKPRNYAGDAVMMDYVYAADGTIKSPSFENETELGKSIFPYIMELTASRAVRSRRKGIAERLEQLVQNSVQPDVLAVACGHLREVELSPSAIQGRIGRYIALDQDIESLAVVENDYRSYGIEPYHGSVREILNKKADLPEFDFIYSLGLYDYLEERVAQKLTERLFNKLKPGGILHIANFHPNDETSAFIEAFCDWWLIYRNEAEMENLLKLIPSNDIQSRKTFFYENPSIIYLEIQKIG
jgi:extracellular factor (EF) 3-hydroxypalmitic acid methyl ester biosynthesis protein